MLPQIAGLGPGEIALILAVLVLLFGASKLPELARGSGRALRIFKAETKGLMDDDESSPSAGATGSQGPAVAPRELESGQGNVGRESDRPVPEPQAERRDDSA